MNGANVSELRLRALRTAFDRSFADPADAGRAPDADFLTIRVAGNSYALRLSEVASLHLGRTLVGAPSRLPELRGMAAFRGTLAPIYDLGALLGYGAQNGAKWLVLERHASPIGLAFESFEAFLRLTLDRAAAPSVDGFCQGVLKHGERTLKVLHLPTLIAAIAQRIKAFQPVQEG